MDWQGKRVLIAGAGISGKGAYAALQKVGADCSFVADGLRDADLLVVSPGIGENNPIMGFARMNGIPVIGELELGAQLNTAPIYAVTGTNGKTTTVTLLAQMLADRKTELCGNVGTSFAATAVEGGYAAAVVEVSSFQLETIRTFHPHAAAILNIAPDHLDRYADMDEYAAAKLRIAENMTADDLLLLGADDIEAGYLDRLHTSARVAYVSTKARVSGAYCLDNRLYIDGEYLCDRDRLALQGEHNVKNALTAAAMALFAGAAQGDVVRAMGAFTGVEHRIEYVRSVGGKAYYNDSKGTNIAATLCACRTFSCPICLIAGGSDKGLDYRPLFRSLPENVAEVIVTGQTTEKMLRAAASVGFQAIRAAADLDTAVKAASQTPCAFVLLSPAAASFDRYTDYAARGRAYVKAVQGLEA